LSIYIKALLIITDDEYITSLRNLGSLKKNIFDFSKN